MNTVKITAHQSGKTHALREELKTRCGRTLEAHIPELFDGQFTVCTCGTCLLVEQSRLKKIAAREVKAAHKAGRGAA